MSGRPQHLAIIMDGNGRWAQQRGRPRSAGHRAGVETARRITQAVARADVPYLTLYAFSSDNWRRGQDEVTTLFGILDRYLRHEVKKLIENDIRLQVVGRRDRLRKETQAAIVKAEHATQHGKRMMLRLAVDYSARDAIVAAAQHVGADDDRDRFRHLLNEAIHSSADVPDIDLLVRTGGEQRLSDFFLWECAYAELYFSETYWPDFDEAALQTALDEYGSRQRRFGSVMQQNDNKPTAEKARPAMPLTHAIARR